MQYWDLNETYAGSPQGILASSSTNIGDNNAKAICKKLMSVMPNSYIKGEMSNVIINKFLFFS